MKINVDVKRLVEQLREIESIMNHIKTQVKYDCDHELINEMCNEVIDAFLATFNLEEHHLLKTLAVLLEKKTKNKNQAPALM